MSAPPGWYADPQNPAQVRWWDGATWTPHTHPAQPAQSAQPTVAPTLSPQFAAGAPNAPVPPVAKVPPPPPSYAPPYGTPGYAPRSTSAGRAGGNTFSFITMGVVALYVVLAFEAHIVVFGILPVLMSVRAVRAKERLGWVAVACAAVAVLVALAGLAR